MNALSGRPLAGAGVAPLGRPAGYAAELIGTFGLVLFIVLVLTISASPPFGIGGPNGPDFAVVGLVHAFALMGLIAALGGACGAHFNPAVMNGTGSAAHFGAPQVVTGRFLDGSAVRGMVAEAIGAFFLMWAASVRGVRS